MAALQFTNANEVQSNNYLAEVVKGQNVIRDVLTTTTDVRTRAFLMQI